MLGYAAPSAHPALASEGMQKPGGHCKILHNRQMTLIGASSPPKLYLFIILVLPVVDNIA
jgi:hypothetical protein